MVLGQQMPRFLRQQYNKIAPVLNEKVKRTSAGATAMELGYGGIAAISQMTGLAPKTVRAGIREVQHPEARAASTRIRRPEAGRRSIVQHDPTLMPALLALVAPATWGHPERPLLWSPQSLRNLASIEFARLHPVPSFGFYRCAHVHRCLTSGSEQAPVRPRHAQTSGRRRANSIGYQRPGWPLSTMSSQ